MKNFASIWDAIEDSGETAESMRARARVMVHLQKAVQKWDLPQKEAAARLRISQPRLNDVLRGRIDRFSLDALVDLASRAGLKVNVAIGRAA